MKYIIPILIVLISCSSDDSTDYQQVAPTYKNVNYVTITNETTGGGSQFFYLKSGFCLETQFFPNSPNTENFPSTVLEPGKEFYSKTSFKFSVK